MIEQRLALTLGMLVAAHASATPLSAQIVSGQVLDLNTGLPVGTGFIVLVDQADQEVARTLSTSAGQFLLRAPNQGVYRLRSERIGYHAHTSDPFDIASDTTLVYTLRVVALPVQLAAVEVTGEDRCGIHPEVGAATSLVWEEIRKALTATVWSANEELFRFRNYNYERDWDVSLTEVTGETGHTVDGVATQPYFSMPATQLAAEGYVVERDDGNWYYLPDALTLLDTAFLGTHCFHVVRDHVGHSGHVGLAFEPVPSREITDVAGALWLDEATAALRTLEVRYTSLPNHITDDRIGGTVDFMMVPSGAWIVRRWHIRMPKLAAYEVRQRRRRPRQVLRIDGFRESGGEVLELTNPAGRKIYPPEPNQRAPLTMRSGPRQTEHVTLWLHT